MRAAFTVSNPTVLLSKTRSMLGSPMTAVPHDALFKKTFSKPEHATQLLRHLLPKALVDRINFTTLQLCPGSFVDEALVDRHTDLLFSVTIAGREARIYVLCEHASSVDPLLGFRLLAYMVRIWEAFLSEHPEAKRLPAIVPLVVHHSETGWTAATEFEDLLDLDAEGLLTVAEYIPRFRFLLDDLSAVSDESIRSRAMSAVARLVLFCLKHARASDTLGKRLKLFADVIREVRRTRSGREALRVVWEYIFQVSHRRAPEEVLAELKAIVGEEEDAEELVNVAEQLIEQGVQKGRAEGRVEGRRADLLKLLTKRFGSLPQGVVARVGVAEEADLDRWLDRILTAPTLADVLTDATDE
jgi:predicted transposase YdaD